ncbi:MAG TPA: rod shape-determining protein MreC [Planctomycetota bacterium]|nr:rod shape-determining protein MreC [Planctomycetota bacterium]
MRRSTPRPRALHLAALAVLAFLALRPSPRLEGAIDLALAPARVLAELAAPLRLVRARQARAAEAALRAREPDDYRVRRQLFADQARFALPERPELRQGRSFVHAEVVGRADSLDGIVIRPESGTCAGILPGMPVVSGDVYVGRVAEVGGEDPALATVELVTGGGFHVGAVLHSTEGDADALGRGPARMVVGGSTPRARGRGHEFLLAVHNPERRALREGAVRVDEGGGALEPFQREAQGFDLGRLVDLGEGRYALEPSIDYRAGLFQVVVVRPPDPSGLGEAPPADVLFDEAWLAVRATACGEPTPGREGLAIGSGSWSGVREGAAVVSGVRLVGRVAHAGPFGAGVATLGDPGFAVPVLARVEGRERPLPLGRLVSLGRDAGDVLFAWDAIEHLDPSVETGGAPVPAQLFTASSERLVPRGLVLGEAELPRGKGPHVIRLRQGLDLTRLGRLWVRLEERRSALEGEP